MSDDFTQEMCILPNVESIKEENDLKAAAVVEQIKKAIWTFFTDEKNTGMYIRLDISDFFEVDKATQEFCKTVEDGIYQWTNLFGYSFFSITSHFTIRPPRYNK